MSASNLKAVGRWVLVRPGNLPERTAGGIFYNPAWQQKPGDGVVLSVGGRVPVSVQETLKPGARVLFSWINGTDLEYAGELFQRFDWKDLNCVVEREIINRPGNQDEQ